MKRILSISFFFVTVVVLTACQKDEEPVDVLPEAPAEELRYYDEVFDVEVIANVKFGEAVQPVLMNPENVQELFLDIYQPMGDQASARPVIVLAFGGGFVFGNKESADIVALCTAFAKMGYVCASIDYRLSSDLAVNNSLENSYEAVGKAVHDMRAAVRFFHKDAATANAYAIDPNKVFIGGVSAGAVTALHLVHMDASEVPAEMQSFLDENGGLSGNSGNPGYPETVAGIISLCGMLLDDDLINAEDNIPVVSMHGNNDDIVPYGSGTITILNIGIEVDGSAVLHPKLDELGIANDFYTYQGAGHTPFVSNEAQMEVTVNFIRDFLFNLVN